VARIAGGRSAGTDYMADDGDNRIIATDTLSAGEHCTDSTAVVAKWWWITAGLDGQWQVVQLHPHLPGGNYNSMDDVHGAATGCGCGNLWSHGGGSTILGAFSRDGAAGAAGVTTLVR